MHPRELDVRMSGCVARSRRDRAAWQGVPRPADQAPDDFHQREGRLGLAVLTVRKRIGSTAEDQGHLNVVEPSFLRTCALNPGSTNGGVHLLVEFQHRCADS